MPVNTQIKIPESAHFVGIGGIGMSALAQMLKWLGVDVSGSDRAIDNPENSVIFSALRNQQIKLYPQDGSYATDHIPEVLVYSTAIEKDNPDFTAIPDIRKVHRADMLAAAIASIDKANTIAVAGSCGKTTVTAWLAETLFLLGEDPVMIGGGLSNRFTNAEAAGNFRAGNGRFTVFEADESDKSLLKFSPDYAIILNIGTDHYPRKELRELFIDFLARIRKGVVVSDDVFEFLGRDNFAGLKVAIFADYTSSANEKTEPETWSVDDYSIQNGMSDIILKKDTSLTLPVPGIHSAMNAAAILAMCEMLELSLPEAAKHIIDFQGVWRRFDYVGKTSCGAKVYDDYAHNVEKIISCIKTAQELTEGRVLAIFQPHGFAPLEFMKESLFNALENTLSGNDLFAFLPVYYAGGSSSFSPTSDDVVSGYQSKGKKAYLCFDSRAAAVVELQLISSSSDVIVVMGARDNSLSGFASDFTC